MITTRSAIVKITLMFVALFIIFVLVGCEGQSKGFALPPGDKEAGKATFVLLNCNHCHSVKGEIEKLPDGHSTINYELGGEVTRIRTYGDLVTSIINPSHKLSRVDESFVTEEGQSKMRRYNDFMTVQELVDLTAYLESTYQLVPPPYTVYHMH